VREGRNPLEPLWGTDWDHRGHSCPAHLGWVLWAGQARNGRSAVWTGSPCRRHQVPSFHKPSHKCAPSFFQGTAARWPRLLLTWWQTCGLGTQTVSHQKYFGQLLATSTQCLWKRHSKTPRNS
jgi:hypothetical protein